MIKRPIYIIKTDGFAIKGGLTVEHKSRLFHVKLCPPLVSGGAMRLFFNSIYFYFNDNLQSLKRKVVK